MIHFVFWQNIISPHQSAFISELAKLASVMLVVERAMDGERIAQKWEIPIIEGVEIVITPTSVQIEQFLSMEAVQVFSGIDAYPMVYAAFQRAVKKKCWIAVLAEPYRWQGITGWLRKLKYRWLAFRYDKSIYALFATGNTGVRCFLQAGFSSNKVMHWGYFVDALNSFPLTSLEEKGKPRILFVGQLIPRKGCVYMIDASINLLDQIDRFTIIGRGDLEDEIKSIVKNYPQFILVDGLKNEDVQQQMRAHDILVLPSLFDGWGAVVNEALMNGMRVVASENCGSSVLLDGTQRGEIFFFDKSPILTEVLDKWIKKGRLTSDERNEIRLWAEQSISGKVVAKYFFDKIQFLRGENGRDVQAPWLYKRLSQ